MAQSNCFVCQTNDIILVKACMSPPCQIQAHKNCLIRHCYDHNCTQCECGTDLVQFKRLNCKKFMNRIMLFIYDLLISLINTGVSYFFLFAYMPPPVNEAKYRLIVAVGFVSVFFLVIIQMIIFYFMRYGFDKHIRSYAMIYISMSPIILSMFFIMVCSIGLIIRTLCVGELYYKPNMINFLTGLVVIFIGLCVLIFVHVSVRATKKCFWDQCYDFEKVDN